MENREQKRKVLLAGNPNVGKSTLFNALTGMHQHTGNWPGKTVSVATGTVKTRGMCYHITDLPGTYSLKGISEDEQLAAECIRENQADCTVIVCDGSCLERSLILTLQILQETPKAVVCVNLMDEARSRGMEIDREKLEICLGAPVVLTAAGRGEGVKALLQNIHTVACGMPELRTRSWDDPILAAQKITELCLTKKSPSEKYRLQADRLLVSRRFGVPLMFLLLLGIIWLTVWGANYPSALLEKVFSALYVRLDRLLAGTVWWLKGIALDGIYATVTNVISVMLPPMAIFFLLFTFLEDVGYLPRMAFLLDPCMAKCGGCGKQALTLCMGLGCNAVGITGCRILESPRERLAAILTNAMVPCNGRFPALILLGSLFFPQAGGALVVAACVVLGMAGAMGATGVLRKTVLRSESSFLMEIPPLRRPRLGKILRAIPDKVVGISLRAIAVAAPAGAVLWVLANTGVLQAVSAFLEPAGVLLGMNGAILLAFFLSMPANELLMPILWMILLQNGNMQISESVGIGLLAETMTWQNALCTMIFTLFHWPCSTTLLTVYRETGSVKKTAAAFLLPTAVGCSLCFLLQLFLR